MKRLNPLASRLVTLAVPVVVGLAVWLAGRPPGGRAAAGDGPVARHLAGCPECAGATVPGDPLRSAPPSECPALRALIRRAGGRTDWGPVRGRAAPASAGTDDSPR